MTALLSPHNPLICFALRLMWILQIRRASVTTPITKRPGRSFRDIVVGSPDAAQTGIEFDRVVGSRTRSTAEMGMRYYGTKELGMWALIYYKNNVNF